MKKFYQGVTAKPKLVIVLFIIMAAVGAVFKPLVSVNYDMNDYLPEDSKSTVSLDVMNKEFDGGIPNARVMIKNVTVARALEYKEKIKAVEGVSDVMWLDDSIDITAPLETQDKDVVENYYKDNTALYSVTIEEEHILDAVSAVRDIIGDDHAMEGSAVSTEVATKSTVILVLSIETAIWLNLSFPYFTDDTIFYIAYLIISSIQLGATVDYAILMTDRYMEYRVKMPKKKAVIQTVSSCAVSILTSGSALTVVGFLLGYISSHGLLAQLGIFLGRGTLCSLGIVMFVLPGLLYLCDRFIQKTTRNTDFYNGL